MNLVEQRKDFVSRLQLMKEEAGRLGLYATLQRFDYPLRMAGFEIAGDIEACLKYEKALESLHGPDL